MSLSASTSALWDTFTSQRRVLAVGRTIASATRVMDVLALLDDDPRIDLLSTVVPGSEFDGGVHELFNEIGLPVLPWPRAVKTPVDLAVSASANGALHHLRGPLMLLPHGAGHNKHAPGGGGQLADLSSDQLLHNGRPVPSLLMLPGADSMQQLGRSCPQMVPRARIAGDLTAQQLRAHRHLRNKYRANLGVSATQRLVVVSSTWGPRSTLGNDIELLTLLLAQLPVDEYRIALIVHPNVAARHGEHEVRRRLRRALDAGLILIPPTGGWQATLRAADCVLGDNGSTSFYAADMAPVLIAAHGSTEYPKDGPMDALIRLLPHVDVHTPLRPQIEDAIRVWSHEDVESILTRSIAFGVDAAHQFHHAMYELLDMPPQSKPELTQLITPLTNRKQPTSHLIKCTVDGDLAAIDRVPAKLDGEHYEQHLVVATDEPALRLWESATILVSVHEADLPKQLLDRYPACKAVTFGGHHNRCRLHTRSGDVYTAIADSSPTPLRDFMGSLWHWYSRRNMAVPKRLKVDIGGHRLSVSISAS